MAFYTDTGAVPNVTVADSRGKGDYDGSSGWGSMWVFALVIIFLALVFLWGRRDGHDGRRDGCGIDGLIPALALANNKPHDGGVCKETLAFDRFAALENHQWDHVRDDLKGHNEIERNVDKNHYETSRQVCDTQYNITRQNDENYYRTDKNIDSVKHQNALDTRIILEAMNTKFFEMEKSAWDRERADLRERLLYCRIDQPRPMYSYYPPVPQREAPRYYAESAC